ncbi:anthranilate synthase component II [Microbacterium halimionae]|nr:gamma-glutamyl-gamma-aminobutyrate hydrolase family protein [Microbacterium halimionae]
MRVLVVDNHDSFVHTLCGYLEELGAVIDLVEADTLAVADLAALCQGYGGVVISPGPGAPESATSALKVAHVAAEVGVPVLGVCLGHQIIAVACGAEVSQSDELVHGMTSAIHHNGKGVFAGLPSPFHATRYHSLTVDPRTIGADLEITATADSGVVMGISHRSLPVQGVQFHPESVLTEYGYLLLGNWLETAGMAGAAARGAHLKPLR